MDLKDIDAFALGYETGNYDSAYVCAHPDRKKLAEERYGSMDE